MSSSTEKVAALLGCMSWWVKEWLFPFGHRLRALGSPLPSLKTATLEPGPEGAQQLLLEGGAVAACAFPIWTEPLRTAPDGSGKELWELGTERLVLRVRDLACDPVCTCCCGAIYF